ncbi:uncharacterized protein [Arachis hypogaea]|uniref:uncharacterized protein n=1 Tax=Arachis hypogaea TaxID=3818 RepID=UPI000DEC0C0A|nr:uncharacterized protein LOC112763931 [Arachis hypogaea]
MHAALMWTISDFSGFGNLSGWNTYGGRACPTYNLDTESKRLTFSQKWYFMGHRRFLSQGHRFQHDRVGFDGNVEVRGPPVTFSGGDILRQLDNVYVTLGKVQTVTGKRARRHQVALQDESSWKKRSIFFELPYWEYNLLRHNLDVMHIEKNVCDNIMNTILNDSDKSKDNLKARKDLQLMGIRRELWPREDGKYPTAIFSMSNSQKDIFLRNLKNVVFPDGHSSNISRCVDLQQRKLSGLKSHDNHTLMEHLLLIASRNVLKAPVAVVLADFSTFFRRLCSKSIDPHQLPLLQEHVVLTLCQLEIIFSQINRPLRIDDRPSKDVTDTMTSMFPLIVKAVGDAVHMNLSLIERLQAHRHMLVNCTAVENFLEDFRASKKRQLRSIGKRNEAYIDKVVHREFAEWFKHEVNLLYGSSIYSFDGILLSVSQLNNTYISLAKRFKAYNVNGFRFRTLPREDGMRTQNSGVCVTYDTRSYATFCDSNMAVGGVSYYGRLVDIIELNYSGQFSVALFRCIWGDTTSGRGIKQDILRHTCVNFSNSIHTGDREDDEPYILASEARLV